MTNTSLGLSRPDNSTFKPQLMGENKTKFRAKSSPKLNWGFGSRTKKFTNKVIKSYLNLDDNHDKRCLPSSLDTHKTQF